MLRLTLLSILLIVVLPEVNSSENNIILETVEQMGEWTTEFSTTEKSKMSFAYLKTYWDIIVSTLLYKPMRVIEKVNRNKCIQDMIYIIERLLAGDMWAIQMVDSHGKPPPALLKGNIKWPGNYDECVNVYAPPKNQSFVGDFRGQYCSVTFSVDYGGQEVPLSVGICLPDTCDIHEVEADIREIATNVTSMLPFLRKVHLPVELNYKGCQPKRKSVSYPAIAVLTVIALAALLLLAGSSLTAFEFFKKGFLNQNAHIGYNIQRDAQLLEESPKTIPPLTTVFTDTYHQHDGGTKSINQMNIKSFLNCFCLFTNGKKIFNTEGLDGQLLFLNGFRFLSFCWVFLCYVYANGAAYTGNLKDLADMINHLACEIFMNGFFSIDSFFFMSGFLIGYAYFKECGKTGGQIPWTYFYLHRYIRITPVYLVILAIYATLPYILINGANFQEDPIDPVCRRFWLWNVLYINNFLDTFCMGWSWYLALDMQFFVISPIFLITLWRWPKIGYSLVTLCMAISTIINFTLTYNYHIFTTLSSIFPITSKETFLSRYGDFFNKLYDKPYTRINPYVMGIVLAYYLCTRKNSQSKMKMNKLCYGWIASTITALTCIFYMYDRRGSLLLDSIYNSVSHTFFSLSLAWVFYTCYTGQAGPVYNLLSSKIFLPLSRLTYCAFLVNLLVINAYYNAYTQPLQFSHLLMVTTFFGLLPLTYTAAFVLCMLFEYPAIRLEKLVRTKFKTCKFH